MFDLTIEQQLALAVGEIPDEAGHQHRMHKRDPNHELPTQRAGKQGAQSGA
jgi:hypothetical protein